MGIKYLDLPMDKNDNVPDKVYLNKSNFIFRRPKIGIPSLRASSGGQVHSTPKQTLAYPIEVPSNQM